MSCDKTYSALDNLKIQIPSAKLDENDPISSLQPSVFVRKIYEFERKLLNSGESSPVSFNVTPLCSPCVFSPDFGTSENSNTHHPLPICKTENGASSFSSSNDDRLDLFYKTVRGMSSESLIEYLEKSWDISPRDTLRTMFYVRDCRGGKGEKKIFLDFMKWLWNKDRKLFEKNLPCVPYYGCFKDLRKLLDSINPRESWVPSVIPIENGNEFQQSIVSFWSDVLGKDVESLNRNEEITLAAKWVPIQSGLFTREMRLTHKMFRRMVRLLREKLDIVECKMSASEWDKINFERVCSLSHKKYNQAFLRNCSDNYNQYLEMVKKGEKNMNVGQLYPSDIARSYLQKDSCSNETLNLAWEQLLIKTRQKLCSSTTKRKFICVVDTSHSMTGRPMEVAVSLGLFLSELYPESKFYRKFITFSAEPKLQEVQGENLFERINNLSNSHWDMNTNLQSVFSLLLNESTMEDHPDVVLILSDMQFDSACRPEGVYLTGVNHTNLDEIEMRYREMGIKRPRLVFWNLREQTVDFPTTSQVSDTALISGYSPNLIQTLLEEGEICPMSLYRKVIDSPRYDLVFSE
jgi:hypothetical protein